MQCDALLNDYAMMQKNQWLEWTTTTMVIITFDLMIVWNNLVFSQVTSFIHAKDTLGMRGSESGALFQIKVSDI